MIEIYEEDFEEICMQARMVEDTGTLFGRIRKAIFHSTPLPKGHGRLIDADEFHHTLEDMPIRENDKWFNWLQKACNRLAEAPTIIEADRSEEG